MTSLVTSPERRSTGNEYTLVRMHAEEYGISLRFFGFVLPLSWISNPALCNLVVTAIICTCAGFLFLNSMSYSYYVGLGQSPYSSIIIDILFFFGTKASTFHWFFYRLLVI